MRLTDMTVQELPMPESGSKVRSDDSLPSLAVRVRNTGANRTEEISLGRYGIVILTQAREKLRKILA
jgi:hypothetical protein